MCLAYYFWNVIHGCLYNQALADIWLTGAGIKCLYCRSTLPSVFPSQVLPLDTISLQPPRFKSRTFQFRSGQTPSMIIKINLQFSKLHIFKKLLDQRLKAISSLFFHCICYDSILNMPLASFFYLISFVYFPARQDT